MSDPVIQPGGPMTPEALRLIADWFDTYDGLGHLLGQVTENVPVMQTCKGTEVQDDLRRWADQIERGENPCERPLVRPSHMQVSQPAVAVICTRCLGRGSISITRTTGARVTCPDCGGKGTRAPL